MFLTFKVDGSAWKLKTHVTGVLADNHSMAAVFVDCCEWPHDSNLTINIILHVLLWVQKSVKHIIYTN